MFGALAMPPKVKCLMFSIAKGHQTLLQGKNHFKDNKSWDFCSLLCW